MPTRAHASAPHPDDGEVILGVDTHKDTHVAAVLTPLGAILATDAFPATSAGYCELLDWAGLFGRLARAGVEGTGSYGAALTRHLLSHGIQVFDVNRPDKTARRQQGKTDTVDAQAAARAVISGRATAQAKSGDGPVQIARMYKLAKDSAIKARTQAINQLKAVVVSADPALREHLAPLTNPALIRACADMAWADAYLVRDDVLEATLITLQLLAERIQQLTAQVNELKRRLAAIVQAHAPQLVERIGVGPDSAVTLLITAGDNPERLADEASFAALCGASPVERSSGKQQRRRLNRGGDRQANAALYRIVQSRLRWDPRTQAYLKRRTSEGKTRREVIRCLKRYVAREIFSLLPRTEPTPISP
ncbi:IS110 family transposase [Streptomyces adustus]|uniref:IS110 family transposase n=2 Tax=Streptomyces adustus TaxID=1609272 RepID=A0A5N8VSP4_9ACTN|nr:IS110 family transposase [Streptomyces adustus]MPY36935.1 IS110 family transposase [Streptomyces adustus]